jgi:beta-glucanase (GH16 family)
LSSRSRARSLTLRVLLCALVFEMALAMAAGRGGASNPGSNGMPSTRTPPAAPSAAVPVIAATPAQNGAILVMLSDATAGTTIFYTTDGSTPNETSTRYFAPFLLDSPKTLKAIAAAPSGLLNSAVATQIFAPKIASGTLVWSDEFSRSGTASAQPNPSIWTYDHGTNCCGNQELETYCVWASTTGPCNPAQPNAFVGADGFLHIVAENPSAGVYTSGRLKSQGLFSVQYGRIEARMMLPESQGMWPAFWLLGNSIATRGWPSCGEADIMEHIDGSNPPFSVGSAPPGYDWIAGSIHGGASSSNEANGSLRYHPSGFSAGAWHNYGMIWSPGRIQFYVDSPSNIYATFTRGDFPGPWPFDQGPMFLLLNLAVGGDWPGSLNSTTRFPSTMLVDYVRIYAN